jgi:hypothetical protein
MEVFMAVLLFAAGNKKAPGRRRMRNRGCHSQLKNPSTQIVQKGHLGLTRTRISPARALSDFYRAELALSRFCQ